VSRLLGQHGAEVPLADPGHAGRAGEGRLLRTDIDALCVKTICLQQPDELAAPAAKVDDRSGLGRRQKGTNVTSEDKSRRLVSAPADVL
jgi:hypothetical protein